MPVRPLDQKELEEYLGRNSLAISEWGGFVPISIGKAGITQELGRGSKDKFNLSKNILDLFELGEAQIVKFDYSTNFSNSERVLFFDVLYGRSYTENSQSDYDAVLFFDENSYELRCRLSAIFFFAIHFEQHLHFFSDTCLDGYRLSIQDGLVAIYSNDGRHFKHISNIVEQIETNPDRIPFWIASD